MAETKSLWERYGTYITIFGAVSLVCVFAYLGSSIPWNTVSEEKPDFNQIGLNQGEVSTRTAALQAHKDLTQADKDYAAGKTWWWSKPSAFEKDETKYVTGEVDTFKAKHFDAKAKPNPWKEDFKDIQVDGKKINFTKWAQEQKAYNDGYKPMAYGAVEGGVLAAGAAYGIDTFTAEKPAPKIKTYDQNGHVNGEIEASKESEAQRKLREQQPENLRRHEEAISGAQNGDNINQPNPPAPTPDTTLPPVNQGEDDNNQGTGPKEGEMVQEYNIKTGEPIKGKKILKATEPKDHKVLREKKEKEAKAKKDGSGGISGVAIFFIILAVVAVIGGAVYFFFFMGKSEDEEFDAEEPVEEL